MSADNRFWLGRLHVTFTNEPGVDRGGLLREWFSCLTRELFNPGYALFLPTLSERSFQPNPGSGINPRHLAYFQFTGRIFALAILNSVYLSAHLSTPFLKLLIGRSVSLEDLEDIDDDMFRGMKWILDNPVAGLPSELMFTTSSSEIGSSSQVELKENGASIMVTDENKKEYIELLVDHRLKRAIESQATAFCKGFHELISQDEVRMFGPDELDSVICGENIIDVDDWQTNCEFQGDYFAQHPVITLFFSVLRKWSQENLAKLLAFATGSSQVPLGGFAAFKEAGRPMIINCGGEKARLATAHTCENRLDLPKYENEDEMNEKLLYAIENCGGFGMR
jgi:E3 ubiquitin-protein ligase HUWE1